MDEVQNINREDNEKGTLSQKEKKEREKGKPRERPLPLFFFLFTGKFLPVCMINFIQTKYQPFLSCAERLQKFVGQSFSAPSLNSCMPILK